MIFFKIVIRKTERTKLIIDLTLQKFGNTGENHKQNGKATERKRKEEEQQSEVSGTHHKQNGWLLHVGETSVSSKKIILRNLNTNVYQFSIVISLIVNFCAVSE